MAIASHSGSFYPRGYRRSVAGSAGHVTTRLHRLGTIETPTTRRWR